MKLANKKGQLTLFIIIGIIAVAGVVGYFAVSNSNVFDSNAKANKQFPEIIPLVEACIEEVALDGIYFDSLQGGYYNVPEPKWDMGFFEVPIYFEGSKINFPEVSVWESELADFIEDNLIFCLDFSNLEERGFEVEVGESKGVKVFIKEDRVEVDVELNQPIKVSFEGSTATFKSFKKNIDFNYVEKYNAIKEFLEFQKEESEWIPFSQTEELARKYDFYFEAGPTEIGGLDYIYNFRYNNTINVKNGEYNLIFGVKY